MNVDKPTKTNDFPPKGYCNGDINSPVISYNHSLELQRAVEVENANKKVETYSSPSSVSTMNKKTQSLQKSVLTNDNVINLSDKILT